MAEPEPLHVALLAGRFQVRGTFAYTLRLADGLPQHGVEPRVICPDAGEIASARRRELPIKEYPYLLAPLWGRVVREMLLRDLQREPVDLIHVQSRAMLPLGQWLAERLDRPVVATLHDYLPPRRRLRIDRALVRRVIAVSESVATELKGSMRSANELIAVVHSGVESEVDVEALPVLDPGHQPVIGTAGPLEAAKGIPFFLGAAQRVLARRPDVQFVVAGAGPEEDNLRRLADDLDVSTRVTFVPKLYDYSHTLAAMDVYCLPSLKQGLGTIMLEAMSLGKPVIASGVGGVYDVIRDGESGLVVPPTNSARLAERILELLDDPVKARALGEYGRQLVRRRFSVEKMLELTVRIYRETLAAEQPKRAA